MSCVLCVRFLERMKGEERRSEVVVLEEEVSDVSEPGRSSCLAGRRERRQETRVE